MSIAPTWCDFKTYCEEIGPGRGRPAARLGNVQLFTLVNAAGHHIAWIPTKRTVG